MGVKGLWDILDPVQKYTTLQDLEGQTLAVDMSAWVVENQLQGVQRHLLNAHVRNLFFRVSYMIRHNIKLVFVTEGTAPAVKASTIAKRREKLPYHSESKQPSNGHPNMKRNYLKGLSKPCCTLLEHMGIPCVTSTGEAEATCALLNQLGLADAVITEDGDAFLYGARTVYRNFSISKDAHVDAYTTDDIERSLGLSRRHLVALALLIGCDYHDGVPHIGKEKALLLFKTLGEDDPLDRFKRWTNDRWFNDLPTAESIGKLKHCVRCKHPGQKRQHQKTGCIHCSSAISCVPSDDGYECKCEWHQQKVIADKHAVELRVRKEALTVPGFPSDEIIKEFLNFNEDMPKEPFVWRRPKLDMIVGMLGAQLHWDPVDVVKKVIPLITAWDLQDIATRGRTNPQHMKPIRIVQSRVAQGIDSLEVEWEKLDGDRWTTSSYYSTVESEKSFSTAYPDMAKAFFDELLAKRAKKKSKRKNENGKKKKDGDKHSKVAIGTQNTLEKNSIGCSDDIESLTHGLQRVGLSGHKMTENVLEVRKKVSLVELGKSARDEKTCDRVRKPAEDGVYNTIANRESRDTETIKLQPDTSFTSVSEGKDDRQFISTFDLQPCSSKRDGTSLLPYQGTDPEDAQQREAGCISEESSDDGEDGGLLQRIMARRKAADTLTSGDGRAPTAAAICHVGDTRLASSGDRNRLVDDSDGDGTVLLTSSDESDAGEIVNGGTEKGKTKVLTYCGQETRSESSVAVVEAVNGICTTTEAESGFASEPRKIISGTLSATNRLGAVGDGTGNHNMDSDQLVVCTQSWKKASTCQGENLKQLFYTKTGDPVADSNRREESTFLSALRAEVDVRTTPLQLHPPAGRQTGCCASSPYNASDDLFASYAEVTPTRTLCPSDATSGCASGLRDCNTTRYPPIPEFISTPVVCMLDSTEQSPMLECTHTKIKHSTSTPNLLEGGHAELRKFVYSKGIHGERDAFSPTGNRNVCHDLAPEGAACPHCSANVTTTLHAPTCRIRIDGNPRPTTVSSKNLCRVDIPPGNAQQMIEFGLTVSLAGINTSIESLATVVAASEDQASNVCSYFDNVDDSPLPLAERLKRRLNK